MKYQLAIVSGLAAASLALPAHAGTQAEYQALQNWCVERDRHKDDSAWQANNNPQKYFHFQHYCSAMRAMDRINRARNRQDVQYAVGLVKGELQYVIARYPAEYFLMPEVYALRGKAEFLGGSIADAEVSLLHALQLDPTHAGAYVTLIDLYKGTNRKARAVDTVRAALAAAPGHKGLRRKAQELGVEVPEIVTQEHKLENAPAQPENPPVTPVTKEEAGSSIVAPKPEMAPIDNNIQKPADPEAHQTKIGTPGNPWCRFCVEEESTSDSPVSIPSTPPK